MSVYDKLAAIAEPIVQFYKEDLTKHDRAALDKMQPGDVAFWAPRECGTHFVCFPYNDKEGLRWNRDYLLACEKTYPGIAWHRIADGQVSACTFNAARLAFDDRLNEMEMVRVREITGMDLWP